MMRNFYPITYSKTRGTRKAYYILSNIYTGIGVKSTSETRRTAANLKDAKFTLISTSILNCTILNRNITSG